jgi:MEMO1 family protein
MIVFAAITPHSPLLLPTIGGAERKKLPKTVAAFKTLKAALEESRPDVVIIISPHSTALTDAITFNFTDQYQGDLTEFGDLKTKPTFRTATGLIDQLQRTLRKQGQPVTLSSSESIDYGAVVPLALLEVTEQTLLFPIFPASELDFKTHFAFGEAIQDVIVDSQKRIALIASNNLSHRLSSEAPAGFSARGEEFDQLVNEALSTENTNRLLTIDPELVKEAGQCGFRGTVLLLGLLADRDASPRILAYEHPFGVGYLTVQFELQ